MVTPQDFISRYVLSIDLRNKKIILFSLTYVIYIIIVMENILS